MSRFTLATINSSDGAEAAIGVGDKYYRLAELLRPFKDRTTKQILQSWESSLPLLEALGSELEDGKMSSAGMEVSSAKLLAPVQDPDKLLAVGANYSGHLKEMGLKVQKWDSMPFFLRPPLSTLVGPCQSVRIPRSTKQFDWECELAVFVSKRLRHASRKESANAVAGYSVGLDLTCRDLIQVDNDLQIDLARGKAQEDRKALENWRDFLDERRIPHSPIITGIQAWLIVVEDPDKNRLRLYTLETHGRDVKPDEDNPWLRS